MSRPSSPVSASRSGQSGQRQISATSNSGSCRAMRMKSCSNHRPFSDWSLLSLRIRARTSPALGRPRRSRLICGVGIVAGIFGLNYRGLPILLRWFLIPVPCAATRRCFRDSLEAIPWMVSLAVCSQPMPSGSVSASRAAPGPPVGFGAHDPSAAALRAARGIQDGTSGLRRGQRQGTPRERCCGSAAVPTSVSAYAATARRARLRGWFWALPGTREESGNQALRAHAPRRTTHLRAMRSTDSSSVSESTPTAGTHARASDSSLILNRSCSA